MMVPSSVIDEVAKYPLLKPMKEYDCSIIYSNGINKILIWTMGDDERVYLKKTNKSEIKAMNGIKLQDSPPTSSIK